MEQYVITISRQFGSMGRSIAKELSENLGIEFLDRDIVEATAKRMGLPVSVISDEEESMKSTFFRRQYPLGMGMSSLKDEIFYTQKNIIRDFAAKGSCIIVGRCADYILEDIPNHLNVFVYAPEEARLKNCVENLQMDPQTAKKEKKVGDAVKKGDAVLVLEIMKMETPVVAPEDGTVASIDVAVGDAVESGALLATLN